MDVPGLPYGGGRCVRRHFFGVTTISPGRTSIIDGQWIEDRIRFLAESFAVSVYSYAVMSNHAHIVLFVDPDEAQAWSDEEVARRWLAVFPGALRDAQSEEQKGIHRARSPQ